MATWASHFMDVRVTVALPVDSIHGVVRVATRSQMTWVDTGGIVTGMKYQEALRHWTIDPLIRIAVSTHLTSVQPEVSVASSKLTATGPEETPRHGLWLHEPVEPLISGFSHLGLSNIRISTMDISARLWAPRLISMLPLVSMALTATLRSSLW